MAIPEYEIKQVLNPGLLVATGPYGTCMWTLCHAKQRTRSTRNCVVCGGALGKMTYRPITHGRDRMERICRECGQEKGKP